MIQPKPNSDIVRDFQVRVGHWQFKVRGGTRLEALAAAKQRLCHDLPRLWDVIHSLHHDSIHIEELPQTRE